MEASATFSESTTAAPAAVRLGTFAATADVPAAARAAARGAVQDTIGVALAGAGEPAARIVQRVLAADGGPGPSTVLGAAPAGPSAAALANGTAAHALDFDDMCWVTLAHPSAPLVAAGLAVGEAVDASGRALLDAYVVGFEVEAPARRLRRRLRGGGGARHRHESDALRAGLARHCDHRDPRGRGRRGARTGPRRRGDDARSRDSRVGGVRAQGELRDDGQAPAGRPGGPQRCSGSPARARRVHRIAPRHRRSAGVPRGDAERRPRPLGGHRSTGAALGRIVEGGITVKLYPSCAATHPTIDTLRDPAARGGNRALRGRGGGDRRRSGGADRAHPRPAHDRARGEVQPALLRGGGAGLRPGRDRHVRTRRDARPRRRAVGAPRNDARGRPAGPRPTRR